MTNRGHVHRDKFRFCRHVTFATTMVVHYLRNNHDEFVATTITQHKQWLYNFWILYQITFNSYQKTIFLIFFVKFQIFKYSFYFSNIFFIFILWIDINLGCKKILYSFKSINVLKYSEIYVIISIIFVLLNWLNYTLINLIMISGHTHIYIHRILVIILRKNLRLLY